MTPPERRASRGDVRPGLRWGRDLPSGGPGSPEPHGPLSTPPPIPPPPPPSLPCVFCSFSSEFLSSPALWRNTSLSHYFFWFSLALFFSSTFSQLAPCLHAEIPGPEKQRWALSESGLTNREPLAPGRRSRVATGHASA